MERDELVRRLLQPLTADPSFRGCGSTCSLSGKATSVEDEAKRLAKQASKFGATRKR